MADYDFVVSWQQQSPIDLEPAYYSSDLPGLTFHYPRSVAGVFEHDEFIVEEQKPGKPTKPIPKIVFDGMECPLLKIHFHAPAEHAVAGFKPDLEAHFVHKVPGFPSKFPSALLVVGVFLKWKLLKQGSQQSFASVHDALLPLIFSDKSGRLTFNPNGLLPEKREQFWRYEGSLTTPLFERSGELQTLPPFAEFVSWIVLKEHGVIDTKVEVVIEKNASHPARGLQPKNRRFVLRNFQRRNGSES